MYSLKGLLILANTVEKPKRSVFPQTIQSDGITAFESNMRDFKATLFHQRFKQMQRKLQNVP